ncbi:MAG: signal peptide peptidase SppA [Myxococcota bacterium]|nr:signal peptide peptidase SppA [Myxococcota bacterium]
MIFFLCSLTIATPSMERPNDIASSSAIENRPNLIWSNPANMGFIQGTSSQLNFQYIDTTEYAWSYSQISSLFGFGLHYQNHESGTWWSTATALNIPLGNTMNLGALWTWHSPFSDADNYNSFDLGASFRPTSWLGASASVHNIGSKNELAPPKTTLGLGLRMFDGIFNIGAEQFQISDETRYKGVVWLRPLKGLDIKVESDIAGQFGGGIYLNSDLGMWGGGYTQNQDSLSTYNISYVSKAPQPKFQLQPKQIALFELNRSFPYSSSGGLFSTRTEEYLSLLRKLHQAARAKHVSAIALHIDRLPFSFAQLEEIGQELKEAKKQGKQVVFYLGESSGNAAYYLASIGDRIYLHPSADLGIVGLSSERMYFRGALDLIGVEPEFIRKSEYKSAPEVFIRHESSPASQEQDKKLLDDVYKNFTDQIGRGRNFKPNQLQAIIDNAPYTAEEARKQKLVDGLLYPDQFESTLEEQFKNSNVTSFGERTITDVWDALPEIAIIYVDGAIISGESQSPGLLGGDKLCGSKTIAAQFKKAQERPQVKAVVLRIDSPGGSAFASEDIWRAIQNFKQEQKPVIVSMGGVAASGGYYIASGADTIFAESNTITGSIGVYGSKFNFKRLYDLLGINVEIDKRGNNAALQTTSRPWTPTERDKMENLISSTYQTFKQRVSDGRSLSMEKVEEIARGRVWSGQSAQKVGLVDEIGGFYDAIEHAKKKAGITAKRKVNLIQFKGGNQRESPFTSLIGDLKTATEPPSIASFLPPPSVQKETTWMLMPYRINIR